MKQFITTEQLKEIDDEELNYFIKKEWGKVTAVRFAKQEMCKRCFNVGELIEFLDKRLVAITPIPTKNPKRSFYSVFMDDGKIDFDSNELVDALWMAVKYILKGETK